MSIDYWIATPAGKIFTKSWTPLVANKTEATPIILLHDSLGSVDLWREFPELLSNTTHRKVIAYDRPGFGKSYAVEEPISREFIANESTNTFALVRQALNIQKFIVLGHSVGGGMAIHCAAHYPGDCEALITLSAQVFVEDKTLEGIQSAKKLFKNPKQIDRLKKYHGSKTQWVLDAWINTWTSPEFTNWSLTEVLPKVQTRLLAIHGANDEYGSTVHPHKIVDISPAKSTLMLMRESTHFPHREQTQEVLDAIAQFLSPTPAPLSTQAQR